MLKLKFQIFLSFFNISSGTFVTQVTATDADAKNPSGMGYGDVGYRIDSEFFRIDQKTGKIYVKKDGLDRETSTQWGFNVIAEDMGGNPDGSGKSLSGLVLQKNSVPIVINILDVNDNQPVFDPTTGEVDFPEDAPTGPNGMTKKFRVTDRKS